MEGDAGTSRLTPHTEDVQEESSAAAPDAAPADETPVETRDRKSVV